MLWGLPCWPQWLRICLAMQGTWVRSLVGELRSHKPLCTTKKKKKECCKFEHFKIGQGVGVGDTFLIKLL